MINRSKTRLKKMSPTEPKVDRRARLIGYGVALAVAIVAAVVVLWK